MRVRPPDCDRLIARLSREIALACDAAGEIVWMDDRATALLGEGAKSLRTHALGGTESKVDQLVERASKGPVARFEVSLALGGGAKTYAFRGEPSEGGAVLVGQLVDDDEATAFGAMSGAMTELAELQRQTERQRRELADSNRALLSMHAELDEKNHELRRASDIKSRVVANVSHELRTPINSILGISQLLLARTDGELSEEQETQVRFVKTSAEVLGGLIDDILDLARIESGRLELRTSKVALADLFSSLRGMMKPLAKKGVEMVVEDAPPLGPLDTDAGKVSQILRNLVSNAVKFTETGEIRVRAREPRAGFIAFDVVDSGIGISPEDQPRVFEEFVQIDSAVQRRVRGTGLGLSLSKKLAELLGGTLKVQSELGKGSTFTLEIPLVHEEVAAVEAIAKKSEVIDKSKAQVLVVEDNRQTLFLYEKYLSSAGFQVLPARTLDEARRALARTKPAAIVLDVLLEGEATWTFLQEVKADPANNDIPVMVLTVIDRAQQARALGADEFWLKPVDGERLTRKLLELAKRGPITRILMIDDDAASRYLLKKALAGAPYTLLEATGATEGVRVAREEKPDVIFLDFVLGEDTAFDVIDELKADPDARCIPIVILTGKTLDDTERTRLERETSGLLRKQSLSRELAITRIREALEAARRQ